MISVEQVEALPLFHRATIPADYLDPMGHMNIRWYIALFDQAAWKFFGSIGMSRPYFEQEQGGLFALKQFISYLAEVHVGETVAIRTRVLGRSVKRLHFMHFMVNESRQNLAATLETLTSHADLAIRRTSPFPARFAESLDDYIDRHEQLGWPAPVCGVIQP